MPFENLPVGRAVPVRFDLGESVFQRFTDLEKRNQARIRLLEPVVLGAEPEPRVGFACKHEARGTVFHSAQSSELLCPLGIRSAVVPSAKFE